MRIFCIILTLIILFSFAGTSAQDTNDNKNFLDVQLLINEDLSGNLDMINEKSKDLTETQKLFLYDENKKSPYLPFVLNFCLGFGIGSWIQGNYGGGMLCTVGEGIGIALWMSGAQDGNKTTYLIGMLLSIGTWIIDCILPFKYSSSYNGKLKSALGITGTVSLEILPKVDVTQNGNVAPGMTFSVSF